MTEGVDYAGPSSINLKALKAAGKTFVVRYISGHFSQSTYGKDVCVAEKNAILASGLHLVLVWETDGRTGPLMGTAGGNSDGPAAVTQAHQLGAPAGTCLYFAVDFDAANSLAAVQNYAAAAAAHCRSAGYRAGIYGGLRTVQYCAGRTDLLWQTYAWSYGQWFNGIALAQYQNGVHLAGGTVDLDRGLRVDYGQWGAVAPAAPTYSGGTRRMFAFRPGDGDRHDSVLVVGGHLHHYWSSSISGDATSLSGQEDWGAPAGKTLVAGTEWTSWDGNGAWQAWGCQVTDGAQWFGWGTVNQGNQSGWKPWANVSSDLLATGPPGPPGAPGADSTVPGPIGPPGADSTVPGPPGPPGTVTVTGASVTGGPCILG